MSFTQAIESCFKNYFTFTGRAPRSEYNYWTLFNILLGFIITIVVIGAGDDSNLNNWTSLFSLALLPANISTILRRLHDTGKSGWNWFWFLTIIAIPVVSYWLIFQEGEHRDNKYGSNPLSSNDDVYKQSNNPNVISSSDQSESTLANDDEKKPKAEKRIGSYNKGGLYD